MSNNEAPERIWVNSIPLPETGCWIWLGATMGRGYGAIRVDGKQHYAHRFSFEAHHRPLSAGEVVRHRCDNPICVNPDHLLAGSQKDNLADANARKRLRYGEENPAAKHSDETINHILLSDKSNSELSEETGICRKYIWQIRAKQRRNSL